MQDWLRCRPVGWRSGSELVVDIWARRL